MTMSIIFTILAAACMFASILSTLKILTIIRSHDNSQYSVGVFVTASLWTITALFAGWLS